MMEGPPPGQVNLLAENIIISGGMSVAVGPGASAAVTQVWNEVKADIDLPTLANQLATLYNELRTDPDTPRYGGALGHLAEAEAAARGGDGPRVLEHLRRGGKWLLGVVRDAGPEVLAAAAKAALQLPG